MNYYTLNNNIEFAEGVVGHKLGYDTNSYADLGEVLDDLDGISQTTINYLENWINRSSGLRNFGEVIRLGNQLGDNIVNSLRSNGHIKNLVEQKLGISLDGYSVLDEVPFTTQNGYMKADAVLIKFSDDGFGTIEDVIIIENKLSVGTAFTTRQKEGFRTIKNSTTEMVEFNVQYSRPNLNINDFPTISVNRSRVLKINDAGTDNINSIGIEDIHFIKDLNF